MIGLPLAVEHAGYTTIMWDVEERTERFNDPQEFADDILRRVRPGSIILIQPMYRHNRTARAAISFVLTGLKAKSCDILTVGDLSKLREP